RCDPGPELDRVGATGRGSGRAAGQRRIFRCSRRIFVDPPGAGREHQGRGVRRMIEANVYRANEMPVLLAYPFRPFFLLTALYGGLLVAAWAAFLLAGLPLPLAVNPAQWHAHELLFGMVPV